MDNRKKVKILAGLVFGVAGLVMIYYGSGALSAAGVFLTFWAHNIEKHL